MRSFLFIGTIVLVMGIVYHFAQPGKMLEAAGVDLTNITLADKQGRSLTCAVTAKQDEHLLIERKPDYKQYHLKTGQLATKSRLQMAAVKDFNEHLLHNFVMGQALRSTNVKIVAMPRKHFANEGLLNHHKIIQEDEVERLKDALNDAGISYEMQWLVGDFRKEENVSPSSDTVMEDKVCREDQFYAIERLRRHYELPEGVNSVPCVLVGTRSFLRVDDPEAIKTAIAEAYLDSD